MAGLVEAEARFIEGGAGEHSDGACDHACFIGKDISEHVLGHDDVKLLGLKDELHGAVIDIHVGQGDFRIILCDLGDDPAPQAGSIEDVGLVHAADLFAAFHGDVESGLRDPADLIFIIFESIDSSLDSVDDLCIPVSEVQAAGQLADDDEVKDTSSVLCGEGTGIRQLAVEIGGTQVCIQAQRFAKL